MLKAAHIPVDDRENTDCYRAGTPGRRKMDAMVLTLCKTPLGRLCVSDHAMHAVAEMQYLEQPADPQPATDTGAATPEQPITE